jgi:endoglucanase
MKTIHLLFAICVLLLSCSSPDLPSVAESSDQIRINQVGYYPQSIKEFVVADLDATSFMVLNKEGKVKHKGQLQNKGSWEASGEQVSAGDFSELSKSGTYRILLNTGEASYPFEIGEQVLSPALDAAIKSFYFQRASMAIEEAYGGIYQRAAGHPDVNLAYHPSSGKSEGTLDSPGGWYDAGDYGKYVVNAAITAGQMLNLLELFPDAIADNRLNIPESGNGISDLLDEIRYELDWVATMQDADGGVYHKLTARNFGGFIMPEDYDLERVIIGKATAATLDFAAVMAQASRVFRDIDPGFASDALTSAEGAWKWAMENPDVVYRNPEDVSTGEYGDDQLSDEFYWAAAELYISTGKETYKEYLVNNEEPYTHQITNSWKFFIRNMGFHTLLINKDKLDPSLADDLTKKHLALSDEALQKMESVPYGIGIDHFEWGSNSDVLDQAMILCIAHHFTGEQTYLDGAIRNLDYIFGKNATGYSFLTGYGSKHVMNPHHRPSGADGIEEPVPGFILGGPNDDRQDIQYVEYASEFPAKAFEDVEPSFASNEVCLNWNSPAVFVLGYLEQVMRR